MPEEIWTEVSDIVPEAGIKTNPKKKKCKNAKWLSEVALQTGMKRREAKGKGEKERYTHLNAEFQRIARRDKGNNRFKGVGLIECLINYGWRFIHCTGDKIKTIPKKNKCKKSKYLSEEAIQLAEKRREAKDKGEKERYTHLNAEFQRIG